MGLTGAECRREALKLLAATKDCHGADRMIESAKAYALLATAPAEPPKELEYFIRELHEELTRKYHRGELGERRGPGLLWVIQLLESRLPGGDDDASEDL